MHYSVVVCNTLRVASKEASQGRLTFSRSSQTLDGLTGGISYNGVRGFIMVLDKSS